MGKYDEALEYIYRALEINPRSMIATTTLAEINAHKNNLKEFYKNLELAFNFGLDSGTFQTVLEEEDVYEPFYEDAKFLDLLGKYNISIDFSSIKNLTRD